MAKGQAFDTAALLRACNPWWQGGARLRPRALANPAAAQPADDVASGGTPATGQTIASATLAKRVLGWLGAADAPQVLLLEGQRLTGKTTLLDAVANGLLAGGLPVGSLCRALLDGSPLRWQTVEHLLDSWQALYPGQVKARWLLVDDLHLWPAERLAELAGQLARTGVRLVAASLPGVAWPVTGAAVVRLNTASFADFLQLRGVTHGLPPAPRSLRETFEWPRSQFVAMTDDLRTLGAHFHDYLMLGGYLPALHAPSVADAHTRLREALVRSALSVDGPARHNIRRIDDLLRTLDYLAARSGSLLDVPDLCGQLSVERPTVRHFLQLLEDLALVRRVPPLGYGDSVQRARFLICMQDPALTRALLHQEQFELLSDAAVDAAVESAIHRHLQGTYGSRGALVSYAPSGRQGATLVVGSGRTLLPFARHYGTAKTTARDLGGLIAFCQQHAIPRAYVATRVAEDCGPLLLAGNEAMAVMRLPAALLCLWLAAADVPRLELRPASLPAR